MVLGSVHFKNPACGKLFTDDCFEHGESVKTAWTQLSHEIRSERLNTFQ